MCKSHSKILLHDKQMKKIDIVAKHEFFPFNNFPNEFLHEIIFDKSRHGVASFWGLGILYNSLCNNDVIKKILIF